MVFYFTCSDPRYLIYMGRDKYENEHLIAYGWPEDLWFHVDKMSSAHVYLRMPPSHTVDDVPLDIVNECAQLTKLNSIEGCKQTNVAVVYTPWSNLRKDGSMDTGQVGFHSNGLVRRVVIERRINEIVNRLNKTKEEKHNNPAELFDLRQQRDAQELAAKKSEEKAARKADALKAEEARQKKATEQTTIYGVEAVDEAAMEAAQMEQLARISASMASPAAAERCGGYTEEDAVLDMFGDVAEKPKINLKKKGKGGLKAPAKAKAKAEPAAEPASGAGASVGSPAAPALSTADLAVKA